MKNVFFVIYFISQIILIKSNCFAQNNLHLLTTMSGDSTGDQFSVVVGVGDVNGDGYDDFVVGAPGGNYVKLFFGGATFDTTHYIKLVSDQKGSLFGFSIAGGDINGDGYSDIIIGAPHYSVGGQFGLINAGQVYIYFGGKQFDTIPAFILAPGGWYYEFGKSVSVVGDVNGDGYKDIAIGAPNDDYDAHGRVYIYFGGPSMDAIPDVLLEGIEHYDSFGTSVTGVGDVNKDGYDDVLIGAPQQLKSPYTGKAYLVFGGHSIALSNSELFIGDSTAHGQYGRIVAGLGDINGDSFPDFGIMALNKVNIFFSKSPMDTIPNLTFYPGRDFSYLGCMGDLNKDGFNDFAAVSDSLRFYFGAANPDTVPQITFPWAYPVSFLGNINSDKNVEIAYAIVGGWDPKGRVYIYSYGSLNSVEETNIIYPKYFKLEQNFPNPFNPETTIKFEIIKRGWVNMKIFDILGREIKTLINEIKYPGNYTVRWNATGMPSGVYFYRLMAETGVLQKKMVLLR